MALDVSRVRDAFPGRPIHYLDTTTTTMGAAAQLAASGAPAGTLVLADRQTAGRGRLGRAWYSEAEAGIYFTEILRPSKPAPILTLGAGLAVHAAIREALDGAVDVDVRWPNDVLVGGRKCAGILVTSDGDSVLVGVGVNVNHTSFPEELALIATSLRVESGRPHSREALLIALVRELDTALGLTQEAILERFCEVSSYARGKRVIVEESGLRGVTCGLDPDGFLLISLPDGRTERVLSGGVRPI